MFSVKQKRDIANKVQQILKATNHPELPREEIQFSLHVDGAASWSWADIQNNGNVPNPSVNPWNEALDIGTPTNPQHGREPDKVKPLAQYLGEYLRHEISTYRSLDPILEQALDAYQSTENVTIKIERI